MAYGFERHDDPSAWDYEQFLDDQAQQDAELERLHRHGPVLPGVGEHIELMDELEAA